MREAPCGLVQPHLPHDINAAFRCPGIEPLEVDPMADVRPAELAIYAEFSAERVRAHAKHGITSMEQQDVLADRRVSICAEELGEASRALNDLRHAIDRYEHGGGRLTAVENADEVGKARQHLRRELIQLGAMATAWIANLDEDRLPIEGQPPLSPRLAAVKNGGPHEG